MNIKLTFPSVLLYSNIYRPISNESFIYFLRANIYRSFLFLSFYFYSYQQSLYFIYLFVYMFVNIVCACIEKEEDTIELNWAR